MYSTPMCRHRNGNAGFREDPNVVKKLSVWLNRVLAMTLGDQTLLFKYFNDTFEACIMAAKSKGEYDRGITSVVASSIKVKEQIVVHTDAISSRSSYYGDFLSSLHAIKEVDFLLMWSPLIWCILLHSLS